MCGAFAAQVKKPINLLPYHLSRWTTYLGLFVVLTLAGLAIEPLQTVFGWAAAIFAILVGLSLFGWLPWQGNSKFLEPFRKLMAQAGSMPGPLGGLSIGFLNGFIPCHLVYAAIAQGASKGNLLEGAAFMVGFGLGTSPLLSMVTFGSGWAQKKLGAGGIRKAGASLMLVTGLAMVYRVGFHGAGHQHEKDPPASTTTKDGGHSHHHHH